MTWSIVARDPQTGHFGIAVASKVLAVGAMCPWLRFGIGAVSSQSFSSPLAGERSLTVMALGFSPDRAIEVALTDDEGRSWRQIHGVDEQGRAGAFTGTDCVDWCGHWTGENVSVAGNMLTGPDVVEATANTWLGAEGLAFDERLLVALAAGEAAGGDKRGKQSAAIKVVGPEAHAELDLRVDDHAEPITELRRLFEMHRTERRPVLATRPTRANPSGIFDPAEREAFIARYRGDT